MKSTVILFCLGLLCLMLPESLRADTIYTYTGYPDTDCEGVYYCSSTRPLSMPITFDVPLAGDQLDNLPYDFVPVSSFSITDGTGLYVTQANSLYNPNMEFKIATDPTGAITNWYILAVAYELYPPPLGNVTFASYFNSPDEGAGSRDVSGVSCFCGVQNGITVGKNVGFALSLHPGVWSSSSTPSLESSTSAIAIPEPSTVLLLLLGILALWAAAPQGPGKRKVFLQSAFRMN